MPWAPNFFPMCGRDKNDSCDNKVVMASTGFADSTAPCIYTENTSHSLDGIETVSWSHTGAIQTDGFTFFDLIQMGEKITFIS